MDEKKTNKSRSNSTTMNASLAFANRQHKGNARFPLLKEGLEPKQENKIFGMSQGIAILVIVVSIIIITLIVLYAKKKARESLMKR